MRQKMVLGCVLSALCLLAAPLSAQKRQNLKEKMALTMNDGDGSNGASVAYHAKKELYYAAFAGNGAFPLVAFNNDAESLETTETQIDVRGLWYNAKTNQLCGNAYADNGWFNYTWNSDGSVESANVLLEDQNQPDDNSVGTLDAKNNKVIFANDGKIIRYDAKTGKKDKKEVALFLGLTENRKNETPNDWETSYNYTSVIYTGISKAEYGLLNVANNTVELYDAKSGYMTQILQLPENAPVNAAFNFAYANGFVWLFDKDNRIWMGYK